MLDSVGPEFRHIACSLQNDRQETSKAICGGLWIAVTIALQLTNDSWRVQFFGELKVRYPEGQPILDLAPKAAALLGILYLSRPYGESRLALGDILWPTSSKAKQLGSVRNALLNVRRILGADAILSSSTHLWLNDDLRIESDIEMHNPAAFMPGFEGLWFEARRSEFDVCICGPDREEEAKSGETITRSFLNLLRWYASHNPIQMLETMRVSIDMSTDLPPSEVRSLLKEARPHMNERTFSSGWVRFWHGWLLEHEQVGGGELLLDDALTEGLLQHDFALAAESLIYLFASGSLRSRPDLIETLSNRLDGSPEKIELSVALKVARANYLAHLGNHPGAVANLIDLLSIMDEEDVRRLRAEALLGFYEACQGRIEEAEFFLARARLYAQSQGNFRLSMICSLGDAHVLAARGCLEEAVDLFSRVVDVAAQARSRHIEIYGLEGLATSYLRMNGTELSDDAMASSRLLRSRLGMPYSPWDKQRIRRMLASPRPRAR